MSTGWSTTDCQGKTVEMDDQAWAHAVRKRPFLAGLEQEARLTVEDPDVCAVESDGSVNYYRQGGIARYPKLYMHVVARDVSESRRKVHTVWPSKVVDDYEELLWLRGMK